jgi:hypothetical protein
MKSLNNLMINQKKLIFYLYLFYRISYAKIDKKKLIFNYILQITTIFFEFYKN